MMGGGREEVRPLKRVRIMQATGPAFNHEIKNEEFVSFDQWLFSSLTDLRICRYMSM